MANKNILLIEPGYKNKYPPLGLMKIAQYHGVNGKKDNVKFIKGEDKTVESVIWDRIYITTLFSFEWSKISETIEYASKLVNQQHDKIFVGGIAASLMHEKFLSQDKWRGIRFIQGLLDKSPAESLQLDDFEEELTENEYLRMETSDGKSHLFQHREGYIAPVGKVRTERAKPRNLEQRAALDLLLDSDIELVALLGKAGTGKTFLALAAALEQSATYTRILLSKPVVDVGRGIGFLPGSLQEKLEPWMQSFFDNLDQISPMWDAEKNGQGGASSYLEDNYIEIQPIHSIRGRSLKQAFMIIDEAQNLTKHEIKSIITRAAEGTKVVLLGDPFQIDHPYLDEKSNGLVYVIEKMKGEPLFGAITLNRSERSKLSDIAADKL